MSFESTLKEWQSRNIETLLSSFTLKDVEQSLSKQRLSETDFLALLSPAALPYLEQMATKAQKISIHNFGRTIQLYIPLYLSNYCSNNCVYCGFSVRNAIHRNKLSLEEIEENAQEIAKTEIKHILILTGEAPKVTPMSYLLDAVGILKKHFASVSIEIFPMSEEEYRILKKAGVDGLTVYQEVYDPTVYQQVHLSGKKSNYSWRIEAPERGARAGFRSISIGTLFGLTDTVSEAFYAGLHAHWLQHQFLDTEFSLSLPRLNTAEGNFTAREILDDRRYVQFILAYRLFLPRVGLNLSTRERPEFRDNLIPLGITKMSAGSHTEVGGYHSDGNSTPQFEIADHRSVEEVSRVILQKGYEPVYKDWEFMEC